MFCIEQGDSELVDGRLRQVPGRIRIGRDRLPETSKDAAPVRLKRGGVGGVEWRAGCKGLFGRFRDGIDHVLPLFNYHLLLGA